MLPPALVASLSIADVASVGNGEGGTLVSRLLLTNGRHVFVKHGSGATADDIADEAARLAWLQGRLPCAPLIDFAQDEAGAWLLTAALPGRVVGDWLRGDRASLPRVVAGLVDVVRSLQALPVTDRPFDSSVMGWLPLATQRMAPGRVDVEDFDDAHAGWSAEDVLAEVERRLSMRGRVSWRMAI